MIQFTKEENNLIDDCYLLILDLIKEAGELVKQGFNDSNKRIDFKEGNEIVTEYDKRTQAMLINRITAKYPDHSFIAEESEINLPLTDNPTWVIDPIDGTNNFVHGLPFFAIAVAFVLRKDVVIGITYNPILNELYRARIGSGTFLNDKQIFCNKTDNFNDAIYAHEVSFISIEQYREKNIKQAIKFAQTKAGFRSFGSASVTLAFLARGSVDAYQVDELFPWDIAAGSLQIREAGGVVYNSDGTPLDIMRAEFVCASTEKLCQQIFAGNKEAHNWILTIKDGNLSG